MNNELYNYSPIVERPRLAWPNGARVAFYVGLNVEHFAVDKPSTSIWAGTSHLIPDPLNYGWRDYGVRVGIWRLMDALDRYGVRASVLLNSEVAHHYPHIIRAGNELGISASAVGKTIARLESELGVRLFHRSTRSVSLTAEGESFLERSRRILSELEAARSSSHRGAPCRAASCVSASPSPAC